MQRTYIPGVCNLSDAEARRRDIAGWIGLVLVILLEALFLSYAQIPLLVRFVIFFPATIGAMGFLQGIMHFCVSFGTKGIFNVSDEVGKTETVAQAEHRAQDKAKAKRIIAYSVAIGIVITLVAYLI